jgi:hypothetical protein
VRRVAVPRWVVALSVLVLLGAAGYNTLRVANHASRHARDPAVHRDFDHFYHAAVAGARGEDPYLSFRKGYLYPPLLAAAMRPLARLERNPAYIAWFAANTAIVGTGLAIGARALLRRFGVEPRPGAVLAVVAFGVVFTFDQLRWQLEHGQTDGLALLGFALGLAWLERRPVLAGMAMGAAANVKYLTLIAAPFAGLRGRWRLLGGVGAGAALGAVAPAAVFGWERTAGYLSTSLGRLVHVVDAGPDRAQTGEINVHSLTWEMNVSLPAFAAKSADRLGLDDGAALPLAAALAAGLVVAAWLIYARRGERFWLGARPSDRQAVVRERATLEWLGLIVAVLAVSPQTTVRHMVLLGLVYQAAAVFMLAPRPGAPRWLPAVGVAAAWLTMTLPPGGGDGWMSEVALPWWRSVAGSMWGALAAYALLLWSGLAYVRAGGQNSESAPAESMVTPM